MKKLLLTLLGISFGAALFAVPPPPRPPVPPPPPVAPRIGATTPHGWFDNFEAAQHEARRLRRPMLVLFTGSDWCGFCIKLKREALDSPAFRRYAHDRLVLVYLDFPRRSALPRGLRHQNEGLAKRFGVRGFPTTVILSPHGHELGRIGGYTPHYLRRVMHYAK